MTERRRTLAVALHDVEPATFERCALIRDWLDDHGVERITLMVIPARDLHPLAERSPDMVQWLIERERGGDAIAQHGFQHLRPRSARRRAPGRVGGPYQALRTLSRDRHSEFVGLDALETRRSVDAGRRVLKLAGIEPKGFVAPGYAYTPALRQALSERFQWWAALLGLHRPRPLEGSKGEHRRTLSPPMTLASASGLRRAFSPALMRARGLLSGEVLRLDIHPADLERANHMLALEWLLARATADREAVTYDELAAETSGAATVSRLNPAPSEARTVRVP